MVEAYVTQLPASPAVADAAWGTGVSAEDKDTLKRNKYGCTGMGARRFVPPSSTRELVKLRWGSDADLADGSAGSNHGELTFV